MKQALKRALRWDARSDLDRSVFLFRFRYALAAFASLLPLPLPWLMRIAGTDKHRPHRSDGHRYGPADADPLLLPLARRIRRIAFEHNVILVTKGENTARSNTVRLGT